jgi:hypothetical protein
MGKLLLYKNIPKPLTNVQKEKQCMKNAIPADLRTEIEGYIKRSIADISRKCNVYDTDIIETFKKLYEND